MTRSHPGKSLSAALRHWYLPTLSRHDTTWLHCSETFDDAPSSVTGKPCHQSHRRVPSIVQSRSQRPGNDFEVGRQGGKRLSGFKITHTQTKNSLDFAHYFFGRDPSSCAKTNKNKNERHRQSKVGGATPPPVQKLEGKRPRCPPPPLRFPGLCALMTKEVTYTVSLNAHEQLPC